MRLPGTHAVPRRLREQEPGPLPPHRPETAGTKRRMEEEEGAPALKLFLSEDAVTARLQRLSLDNDHRYGSSGFPRGPPHLDPQTGSPAELDGGERILVDPGEFCMSRSKVLTVCPVLRDSLRDRPPGDILPQRLLHSLSSPCMELVLWSPPASQIQQLICSLASLLQHPRELPSPPACPRRGVQEVEDHMEL
ncbi:host cell factor C1 regulator 1 isoform X1 [Ascaphus truei]|uniref:host cell factor C1 regulator 1 isoform X1 n=1 Tax=Ascaphus truei TaxID=8439 RepID=UPI003F59CDBE